MKTLAARRAAVRDLVDGTRPLPARSVLASALLGATEPELPVAALVTTAGLFGISSGAARTCLWRMVTKGELTTDDGTYRLAGSLLERRQRVDESAAPAFASDRAWSGTWELAVVATSGRPALDRLDLRKAATALHLAELREGTWTRPQNLDPARLPTARAVLAEQCVQFRDAVVDNLTTDEITTLFDLDAWARIAARFITALDAEISADRADDDPTELLTFRFLLSIAVVRHLQRDPHLPPELLPHAWPAEELRNRYRAHDAAFKRDMTDLARQRAGALTAPP